MKSVLPRNSVRFRLLLLAIGVELVMLTLLIGNSLRLLHVAMTDQARWQVKQIMPVLNAALLAPLAQRDFATLRAVLDESRATEGIEYIVVSDREGRILASSGWKSKQKLPEPSRNLPMFSFSALQLYDEILPIVQSGQQLGILHLGLNLSHIASARRMMVTQGIAIALAELFLSALILALIGYWLTRHLSALTQASLQVASGNLSPPPLRESNDDIGQLGAAFNTMSRAIADRVNELTAAKEAAEASERAKSASEKRLRSITDSTQDAIIMMDHRGAISFWNPAAERTLGYRSDEAIGRDLHELLAPERFLQAARASFPEFSRTGQGAAVGKTLELAARRKDGQEITVALSLSAVSLFGEWDAVGILRDITSQKQAEGALREAKKAAETASQAKSEFLSIMSHEIRTPMNAIIGMADLLLDTPLTEEQSRYVNVFLNAGENLLHIINDVLDLSKIEAGHVEVESVGFKLEDLMAETCHVMATRAYQKGLEFACHILPDVPDNVIGDPIRLRQVVANLIGNAIKFTEKGEVVLEVKIQPLKTVPDEVSLLFSVRDTGIGIAKEKLDTVFEMFTQADSSTTRKYGGSGLGLSIARRLVELMGGHLGVESEVGKGTKFSFSLSFMVQTQNLEDKKTEDRDITMDGLRVLVIDDNDTNRMILSQMLSGWGCTTDEVENGDLGIERLRNEQEKGKPYSLVLLDYRMPVLDGLHVAEKIWNDPLLRSVPVIIVTSDPALTLSAKACGQCIVACIAKPVRRSELKDVLLKALAQQPVAAKETVVPEVQQPDEQRTLTLLLVDDSEDNRLLINSFLKRYPFTIHVAGNGLEALQQFKHSKYNLVLMDMQMPVMDGYAATKEIRMWEQQHGLEPTPIVALTAYALKEEMQKSLDAGCDAHITKPIKKVTLLEAIRTYARTI